MKEHWLHKSVEEPDLRGGANVSVFLGVQLMYGCSSFINAGADICVSSSMVALVTAKISDVFQRLHLDREGCFVGHLAPP